jgi:RimJ/RimL family protein N-acetyltransferase
MAFTPPPHARPSHRLETPRLIFRSAIPSDAKAVCVMRSEPLNNPFGGVQEPNLTAEVQAERFEKQKESTARMLPMSNLSFLPPTLRKEILHVANSRKKEGKNAWMQVILKPEFTEHVVEDLLVSDGVLIGMTGFNCFPFVDLEGKKLLTGDIGAMIDYRYARKGYALETMEALIEYGFNELGVDKMVCFTYAVNKPWRGLMTTMDLERLVKINILDGGEEEAEYRFGREEWEVGKKSLRERGKWLL